MIKLLFWNTSRTPGILAHLKCFINKFSPDVVLLAECPEGLNEVLAGVNDLGLGSYREVPADAKVRAITRLGRGEFVHRYTSLAREMAVWSIPHPVVGPSELLIAGFHLWSKFGGRSDADQNVLVNEVIGELCELEDKRQHQNTVIVGDFNMEPFDPGMTSAAGVHGLMTRRLAAERERTLRGRPRRRFYNPMWGYFGDRTGGPAGTYFWKSSVPHNRHWSMLDQALVRPSLIGSLEDVSILDHDGAHSLVYQDGVPDGITFSDHLPILVTLAF